MARLRICDGCTRHVLENATACPFCGATLQAVQLAPRAVFRSGLSRAQRLAIAATMVGQVSCFDGDDGNGGNGGTGGQAGAAGEAGSAGQAGDSGEGGSMGGEGGMAGIGGGQPVYGAPIEPDSGSGDPDAGELDAGDIGQPEYGASPPPEDAGIMAVPLYGASPSPKD